MNTETVEFLDRQIKQRTERIAALQREVDALTVALRVIREDQPPTAAVAEPKPNEQHPSSGYYGLLKWIQHGSDYVSKPSLPSDEDRCEYHILSPKTAFGMWMLCVNDGEEARCTGYSTMKSCFDRAEEIERIRRTSNRLATPERKPQ